MINQNDAVNAADPIYRVTFPNQHTLPKITRILFNDKVYCSGPAEMVRPGRGVTNVWASTTLRTTRVPISRTDDSRFSGNPFLNGVGDPWRQGQPWRQEEPWRQDYPTYGPEYYGRPWNNPGQSDPNQGAPRVRPPPNPPRRPVPKVEPNPDPMETPPRVNPPSVAPPSEAPPRRNPIVERFGH